MEQPSLPPDLIGRCLELLEPYEVTFRGRLVNKDACSRFSDARHRIATFSIPLPPEAEEPAWQHCMSHAFDQLTFLSKCVSLAVAATSGSELNLKLAWALLQPCVSLGYVPARIAEDAGSAAVRLGHLHLLSWLLQHGCPIDKHSVLEAAARYCNLAEMQHVWNLLDCASRPPRKEHVHTRLVTAGGSSGNHAIENTSWLLVASKNLFQHPERVEMKMAVAAAEGAAATGNESFLQWLLHERESHFCKDTLAQLLNEDKRELLDWLKVLSAALRHGHVAVADWLVDKAGCPMLLQYLEQQQEEVQVKWRQQLWHGAARGGSVESMRWLRGHGMPVCQEAMAAAAASGRLEAVQFLHDECEVSLQQEGIFLYAVGSGSVPLAAWLLQAGCPMSKCAYGSAGNVPMLRWLREEARCPVGEDTLRAVMVGWYARWESQRSISGGDGTSSSGLEQELFALLEAGCQPGYSANGISSIGAAAACGFLPLVRHLRNSQGAPLTSETLAAAAGGGCLPVVKWLMEAGCEVGHRAQDDPYVAAAGGHWRHGIADAATLSCLRRLNVRLGTSTLRFAVQGSVSLRVLRWMVDQGAQWDEVVLEQAVRHHRSSGLQDDEDVAWFAEKLGMIGAGGQ